MYKIFDKYLHVPKIIQNLQLLMTKINININDLVLYYVNNITDNEINLAVIRFIQSIKKETLPIFT